MYISSSDWAVRVGGLGSVPTSFSYVLCSVKKHTLFFTLRAYSLSNLVM